MHAIRAAFHRCRRGPTRPASPFRLEFAMLETIMSRALRRLFAGGAAAGPPLLALPALAQEDQNQPMARVEITGSSIKRLAAETSLPITTIRAGDFVKQGLTTA